MEYKKVNESYYAIQGSKEEHLSIYNFLKAERSNAKYDRMVQRGFRSRYTYFTRKIINNGQETLIVYYGHVQLLHNAKFNILPENNATAYTKDEILDFISQYKSILPFEPYDYQINGIVNGLTNFKLIQQLCTSSGKSLIISMIIEFFRIHNKKGLLIVPNINLLTQFKNDIKSYNLIDLYNEVDILGNGKKSDFTKALTICTWQSLQKIRTDLKDINPDYIICDEVHRMSSDVTSDILLQSINTKIKLGFTGTLPDDACARMILLGLFGIPKVIITSKELIERGLGTPIYVNSIIFKHDQSTCNMLTSTSDYHALLQIIKDCESRSRMLYKIVINAFHKNKTQLVLFSHTEHGKKIFIDLYRELYNINIEEKNIVSKDSLEFQKQYKIYFMNGETSARDRECIRNLMEEQDGALLVANYSLMSTGANIKRLEVLTFASPLKAFTTIAQSVGRLMRLHKDKEKSIIYDIVDDYGDRKHSGIFYNQYKNRLKTCYTLEGFDIKEIEVKSDNF